MRTRLMMLITIASLLLSPSPGSVAAAKMAEQNPHESRETDAIQSSQVIIVQARHKESFKGTLALREKIDGEWQTVLSDIPVVLGRNGIDKIKEGDGKTPTGVYPIGKSFGTVPRPEGLKLFYVQSTKDDYWIDDAQSLDYNRWVRYTGNPSKRWKSFERLHIPLYKYAMIIRYNMDPIRKNKGSAIFVHIWRSADKPTDGCVAMSEENLLLLMSKLDPDKAPIISISAAE